MEKDGGTRRNSLKRSNKDLRRNNQTKKCIIQLRAIALGKISITVSGRIKTQTLRESAVLWWEPLRKTMGNLVGVKGEELQDIREIMTPAQEYCRKTLLNLSDDMGLAEISRVCGEVLKELVLKFRVGKGTAYDLIRNLAKILNLGRIGEKPFSSNFTLAKLCPFDPSWSPEVSRGGW